MPDRPLRRDAQRNRELLLTAARRVFGEQGLDASLEEISRAAGVAIGTLYNRFPTRDALIEAAYLDQFRATVELAEQALAHDDPWAGFAFFLRGNHEVQTMDRGSMAACVYPFADDSPIGEYRAQGARAWAEIVDRAQRSGQLRADFHPGDLGVVFGGPSTAETDTAGRHLGFLLDGLRSESAGAAADTAD